MPPCTSSGARVCGACGVHARVVADVAVGVARHALDAEIQEKLRQAQAATAAAAPSDA